MYSFTPNAERRLLWLLALTQFTVIMDFMVMMPLGPQIMRAFHVTPTAFATAVSAYSWCSGLSGLFAATYIDRFNRRSLLLTMYGLFALSNLVCGYANSFGLLLIARAFAGITGGVIGSVVMAIVGDVIPAQRRGAATGTIMAAFAMASVVGVPVGITLGAHFGWGTPFFLLFALSLMIGSIGAWVVPSLAQHLKQTLPRLVAVLPDLWRLLTYSRHRSAFAVTFTMMMSTMMVIPFLSPILVANHGVTPANLAWLYVAGGFGPFFLSRLIGRLSDRLGHRRVFRGMVLLSLAPLLLITHLPTIPYWGIVMLFPIFMVTLACRMVPLQALLITVPAPANRGAFLSANNSFQSLGSGCGAWLGGLALSNASDGTIVGYGTNGWAAAGLALCLLVLVGRVNTDRKVVDPSNAMSAPVP